MRQLLRFVRRQLLPYVEGEVLGLRNFGKSRKRNWVADKIKDARELEIHQCEPSKYFRIEDTDLHDRSVQKLVRVTESLKFSGSRLEGQLFQDGSNLNRRAVKSHHFGVSILELQGGVFRC